MSCRVSELVELHQYDGIEGAVAVDR